MVLFKKLYYFILFYFFQEASGHVGVSLSSGKFGVDGCEKYQRNKTPTGETGEKHPELVCRENSKFCDQPVLSSQKYWGEKKKNTTLFPLI